jgi:hypothetical protein
MLTLNIDYFKSKPVNIPKITILLDHGYHINYLIEERELVYPQLMTKIRFELSTKPSCTREGSTRKIWRQCQLWLAGSSNDQTLGWSGVKVW